MPWLRSRRRFTPPPTAPVPASEAVRMAALRASWRRDRWVAQRRLWFRWTLWGLQRYAWQICGGVLTLSLLGWWLMPSPTQPPDGANLAVAPEDTRATAVAPDTTSVEAPSQAWTPEAALDTMPLPLRLDTVWGAAARVPLEQAPAVGAAADPNTSPIPDLKPENWLHSKEP